MTGRFRRQLRTCFESTDITAEPTQIEAYFSSKRREPVGHFLQGDEKIRFKWDAANQRWKRITAEMDETDKYSLEKWEEGGVGVIQTKTGGTYTVLPSFACCCLACCC